jgi:hypothetical protein
LLAGRRALLQSGEECPQFCGAATAEVDSSHDAKERLAIGPQGHQEPGRRQ